jgi:hypothetical protein
MILLSDQGEVEVGRPVPGDSCLTIPFLLPAALYSLPYDREDISSNRGGSHRNQTRSRSLALVCTRQRHIRRLLSSCSVI